jgi:hypothetical protein
LQILLEALERRQGDFNITERVFFRHRVLANLV